LRPPAVQHDAMHPYIPELQLVNITSFPSTGDRIQDATAYSEDRNWMGLDLVQDLWQDPFDFSNMSNDPQWEVLFRDLESQPGIYS